MRLLHGAGAHGARASQGAARADPGPGPHSARASATPLQREKNNNNNCRPQKNGTPNTSNPLDKCGAEQINGKAWASNDDCVAICWRGDRFRLVGLPESQ